MKPLPAEEAGTSQHTQDADAEKAKRPTRQTTEPDVKDDGSVPDKHIARWKGEGGSWHPAD